ncbi:ParA family protein [Marinimicrobium alkaliphilum]|uniref:ParA family protein n=1 Tax=Marinimicrobium alkaliphilum TaxID=2202654 RepID=UPI000DB9CB8D|nr:ParA family protein [Marinimicrobium alkaliphilum]
MTRIYAVANQKGGVGKTTTCVNLAASLVATRKRVLLVDLDPQGNATMGSGVDKSELDLTVYDALTHRAQVRECLQTSESGKYAVLPANGDLTAAEVEMLQLPDKERLLKNILDEIAADYDYILIDCPPSLSMLTVNALSACDGVIIPMQCEYYALEGLSALINTITQIQERLNPRLRVEGLLRTMYDPRNSLTNDVSAQLSQHFGDRLYRTCIPRNVRLAEAPSYGQPVIVYDRTSKGAISYLALAGEIIRRNDVGAPQPAASAEG